MQILSAFSILKGEKIMDELKTCHGRLEKDVR